MKQAKNTNAKNKISYLAPGFIIPMAYSIFTALLMGLSVYIQKTPRLADLEWANMVMEMSTASLVFSPPALIICAGLGMKHRNKYPLESALYSDGPLFLSVFVLGSQILYLYSLTI